VVARLLPVLRIPRERDSKVYLNAGMGAEDPFSGKKRPIFKKICPPSKKRKRRREWGKQTLSQPVLGGGECLASDGVGQAGLKFWKGEKGEEKWETI